MIDHLFLRHPHSIGESYPQHWSAATHVGARMVGAGLACMIHAFVPAWFTRTASTMIKQLYGEMKQRLPNFRDQPPAYLATGWQPEYEI